MSDTPARPAGRDTVIDAKSWATMAVLVVVWGSSFLFISLALESLSPWFVTGARLALAAAVAWPLTRAVTGPFPRGAGFWLWSCLYGFLALALPFSLYTWGQQEVPSGVVALFITASPLFVLLLSHLAGDERMTGLRVAGFLTGFLGVGLLVLRDASGGASLWHALACAASGLGFALGSMTVRFMPGYHPLQATAAALVASAVMYLPLTLAHLPQGVPPAPALIAVCVLGLAQTGAAQVLRFVLIRRSGAVFASSTSFLLPLWALVLGWLFLGERLGWAEAAGLVLILGGLGITRLRRAKPKR
ncbi:DMT family transporter [Oceanicella sp. SM1341]|uniref:DMT family transporter n=1 Tax=Oceanicella sp. SM1341 TaxID=1548889 RepID=UPI000E4A1573|nr:DMT family transporter [Oceanicella sp. SM1341]